MDVNRLMDIIEMLDEHLTEKHDGTFISGYSFDEDNNLIVYDKFDRIRECKCFSKNGLEYCIVPIFCFNYTECLKLSPIIKICGHNDWRLPTISECKMLFDKIIEHGHIVWSHADNDITKPISFRCDVISFHEQSWENSNILYNALLLVRKIS